MKSFQAFVTEENEKIDFNNLDLKNKTQFVQFRDKLNKMNLFNLKGVRKDLLKYIQEVYRLIQTVDINSRFYMEDFNFKQANIMVNGAVWKSFHDELDELFNSSKDSIKHIIETKFAIYTNDAALTQKQFKSYIDELDKFFQSLGGIHQKAINPKVKVTFVKANDSKSTAKYKTAMDTLFIRATKIVSGNKYGSLLYVVLHELGHRFLQLNYGRNFTSPSEWLTTKYSMVDSLSEEEQFAELFALSHFKYNDSLFLSKVLIIKPEEYMNRIERFLKMVN